jgi:6,7-dimethyl-8-ribityllumazine synthase
MSTDATRRPRVEKGKRTFQIVAGQFNAPYVQGLIDHTAKELHELAPKAAISIHRVPGSFEIPVVVHQLARKKKAVAIIACGVIMQGETNHAKNLSRSVTDALQRIAIDYAVPVINVVLSFDNEEQARERCLENRINRGTEAARAAVEIANVMSQLRRG